MKTLIFISLLFALASTSFGQVTSVYTFETISDMKLYFGSYKRAHVKATNRDYQICTVCTADEVLVFAGAGGRKWREVNFGSTYIANAAGTGDSLLIVVGDTVFGKKFEILAGTDIAVDKVVTGTKITWTVRSTGAGAGGTHDVKAISANYTVTASDSVLILLDHAAAAKDLTLPAASTMQKQTKTIYCAADNVGEWVLQGTFITFATTGAMTENFTNSGLGAGERIRLTSVEMSTGVWKWIDLK